MRAYCLDERTEVWTTGSHLIVDLRSEDEISTRAGQGGEFRERLQALREQHQRQPAFLRALSGVELPSAVVRLSWMVWDCGGVGRKKRRYGLAASAAAQGPRGSVFEDAL